LVIDFVFFLSTKKRVSANKIKKAGVFSHNTKIKNSGFRCFDLIGTSILLGKILTDQLSQNIL